MLLTHKSQTEYHMQTANKKHFYPSFSAGFLLAIPADRSFMLRYHHTQMETIEQVRHTVMTQNIQIEAETQR